MLCKSDKPSIIIYYYFSLHQGPRLYTITLLVILCVCRRLEAVALRIEGPYFIALLYYIHKTQKPRPPTVNYISIVLLITVKL